MKYFVRVNSDVVIVNSEKKVKSIINQYMDDPDVNYIDYGVVNFDDWDGNSVIAVVKNLEAEREDIKDNDISSE